MIFRLSKINIVFSVLFIASSLALNETPSPIGPYEVRITHIRVGTFVSGGSQSALVYYPKTYKTMTESLPLVAFAHGQTAGGRALRSSYS